MMSFESRLRWSFPRGGEEGSRMMGSWGFERVVVVRTAKVLPGMDGVAV